MQQSDGTQELYFLEVGQISVQMELANGEMFRLCTIGCGAIMYGAEISATYM